MGARTGYPVYLKIIRLTPGQTSSQRSQDWRARDRRGTVIRRRGVARIGVLMQRIRLVLPFLALFLAIPGLAEMDEAYQKKERILKLFVEEFVPLTPGTGKYPASFQMGTRDDGPAAEKPPVTITFRHPFAMAKHEVTQELYEAVVGKNPSKWQGPRNSVEMVSWQEATEFCRLATAELRKRKMLGDDAEIRLPAEAEWEYACRAGTATRYSFGDDAKNLGDYGWFDGNAKGNDPPVGKKMPNAWGLYDMHGYVWEWCQVRWHPTLEGMPQNGRARMDGTDMDRVLLRRLLGRRRPTKPAPPTAITSLSTFAATPSGFGA